MFKNSMGGLERLKIVYRDVFVVAYSGGKDGCPQHDHHQQN
jgi:hypothetical protein